MKNKSEKALSIIICSCLISSCASAKKVETINIFKNINDLPAETVESFNLEFKRANGYGFSAEEIGTMADIYTTYYCAETLELLGKPISAGEIEEYIKYYENNSDYYFFDEKSNDSLLNIYYFCELLNKYSCSTAIREELLAYIYSLQYDEGDFAISINNRSYELENGRRPDLNLLQTEMALKSIYILGGSVPNKEKLHQYIEDRFENFAAETAGGAIADIGVLPDVADLSGYDRTKYNYLIQNIEDEYASIILKNARIDLSELYNMVLALSDENILNNEQLENKIMNILMSLYDEESGAFTVAQGDNNLNILPTYFALSIMDKLGNGFDNTEKSVEWINKFKTKEGGYIRTGRLPEAISDTYYAYKLGLIDEKSLGEYVDFFSNKLDEMGKEDLFFYIHLLKESGTNSEKAQALTDEVLNTDEDWTWGFFKIYMCMALEVCGDRVGFDDRVYDDLDYTDFSYESLCNHILTALVCCTAGVGLKEEQIDYFKAIFSNNADLLKEYDLETGILTFLILEAQGEADESIKERVKNIIDSCNAGKGIYRNDIGGYKSLRSSYLSYLAIEYF